MGSEFDSLYLYDENASRTEIKMNYLVYEPNENLLPLYVVQFVIDSTKYKELFEV